MQWLNVRSILVIPACVTLPNSAIKVWGTLVYDNLKLITLKMVYASPLMVYRTLLTSVHALRVMALLVRVEGV